MTRKVRIGMLTPSSNTVLEPVTSAMLAGLPDVTAHFSRFKVTEIALSDSSDRQFQLSEILRAADLLADARVDVIAWNGTSGSWLGFDYDEMLCQRITAATGAPSCTSALTFREILKACGAQRIGLITPYTADVQSKIIANWGKEGLACKAERHCGLQDNFSFAEVGEATIAQMAREVANEGCDAIAVVCTNMRGAPPASRLEKELRCPIYDSVATTLWKCLRLAGVDPSPLQGWGALFQPGPSRLPS